jgi:hypothetical protein
MQLFEIQQLGMLVCRRGILQLTVQQCHELYQPTDRSTDQSINQPNQYPSQGVNETGTSNRGNERYKWPLAD